MRDGADSGVVSLLPKVMSVALVSFVALTTAGSMIGMETALVRVSKNTVSPKSIELSLLLKRGRCILGVLPMSAYSVLVLDRAVISLEQ